MRTSQTSRFGASTVELTITLDRAGPRIVEVAIQAPDGDKVPDNDRRLLAFDVVENPPTMRELSPWDDVLAPHLRAGIFRSERGEFRLEPLDDGGTRLTGTTWYHLDMAPSWYWTVWSDAILHRIHRRVLEHVGTVAAR